jgi:hypothetical protein
MSTESGDASRASLFTRVISRRQSLWTMLGIGLAPVLVPLGAAALDGVLADVIRQGCWRMALLPAAAIIY